MKKHILFSVSLLLLLLLTTSCTSIMSNSTPDTTTVISYEAIPFDEDNLQRNHPYNQSTDWAYGLSTSIYFSNIIPAENGYYILLNNFLFYMDYSAMEPVPVCNRPNCKHYYEEDYARLTSCTAYMPVLPPKASLSSYEGKIYHIESIETINDSDHPRQDALIQTNADGSGRRIICRIEPEYGVDRGILHRGTFYFPLDAWDQSARSQTMLMALELDKSAKEPKRLLTLDNAGTSGGIYSFTAYDIYLYFFRYVSEDRAREFCIYNTQTQDMQTILRIDNNYGVLNSTYIEDKMYLRCKAIVPEDDFDTFKSYPERLYRSNLDGSNMELIMEGWGEYSSDQRYIFRVPSHGTFDEENHYLQIYDSDGQKVDAIDLFSLVGRENVFVAAPLVDDGDNAMIWIITKEQPKRVYAYYFKKTEIGSGQITVYPICSCAYLYDSNTRGSEMIDLDTSSMVKMMENANSENNIRIGDIE